MLQGGAAVQVGAAPQGMALAVAAAAAETQGKGLEGVPRGARAAARRAGVGWGWLAAWGEEDPRPQLEGLAGRLPFWALAEDLWLHRLLQQSIHNTARDLQQRDESTKYTSGKQGRLEVWTSIGCRTGVLR